MQEVSKNQLVDLKSCLRGTYYYVGQQQNYDGDKPQFNPIFYKRSLSLKLTEAGTFWLSDTPKKRGSKLYDATEPRICTWAKMQFTMRVPSTFTRRKPVSKTKFILELLGHFTSPKNPKKSIPIRYAYRRMRNRYIRFTFYVVNTRLDYKKDGRIAKKQIEICTRYLKNTVMDRRRYPIVLMGDLNGEDNTSVYKALENTDWLSNTMAESIKTYPALTNLEKPSENGLTDYIWQNHFKSLLSATIMNVRPNGRRLSDHRPVFAAFLRKH